MGGGGEVPSLYKLTPSLCKLPFYYKSSQIIPFSLRHLFPVAPLTGIIEMYLKSEVSLARLSKKLEAYSIPGFFYLRILGMWG